MGYRISKIEQSNRELGDLINRAYFYTVIDAATGKPIASYRNRRKAVRNSNPKLHKVVSTKDLLKTL